MNSALKWKLIAGFLLVFIAGSLTGAFVAAAMAHHFLFFAPHHGLAAETMRERLRVELKLTPEQMNKISPIIDKAATQLEQIRMDTARQVHETFAQAHREMSADLNADQRAKLDQMRRRHHRWMHRMHGEEAPPPDGPPQ
jgi:gas vesicle protein